MSKNSPGADTQLMEKLVSLCKRRGFVFQSSEIYGGLNGAWDYGPLGVELLKNIKDAWWNEMTRRSNVEGIDAAILMHPRTWEASGHVENFTDPMIDCKQCKSRYRIDVLFDEISLNVAFNQLAKRYDGRAIASENLKENTVTIHIEIEGYIIQTIIVKPTRDLQRTEKKQHQART